MSFFGPPRRARARARSNEAGLLRTTWRKLFGPIKTNDCAETFRDETYLPSALRHLGCKCHPSPPIHEWFENDGERIDPDPSPPLVEPNVVQIPAPAFSSEPNALRPDVLALNFEVGPEVERPPATGNWRRISLTLPNEREDNTTLIIIRTTRSATGDFVLHINGDAGAIGPNPSSS